MSEHEVIGKQLMKIQELVKERDILIGVVHSIKKGDLDIKNIELQDNGFIINDSEDIISKNLI
tara:strand:+ start:29 stop:217 length:189 start_codon:yes stop_codon:yes gene_type:complete